ncbi:MAG TPA: hypothetical protein PKN32_04560 [Bacteroidales bacterium]|nr:hypothetical protein [Bacteroidales bacterium]
MKKVLILAYDFPPYVSAGALRPYSWYKYFKAFGLYPVVVTRQWSNKYGNLMDYVAPSKSDKIIIEEDLYGTIVKTPYIPNLSNKLLIKYGEKKFKIIRKMISAYYELAQFIFFVGPKSKIYFGAKEFLKSNKIDCIIATGEPFVMFKYASKLCSIYQIPWIADYRDPWTQNKNRSYNILIKKANMHFEKKYLTNACCALTVSEYIKYSINQLVKKIKIEIITNGYDFEINTKTTIPQKTQSLSIAFAGTIYEWHPWRSFLEVCNSFFKGNGIYLNIVFTGVNKQKEIESYIDRRELDNLKLTFKSKLPYSELLNELQNHNILLLFNDYNILGTKIFDYIAAHRLILFCFTQDKNAVEIKNKYYPVYNSDITFSDRLQEQIILETNSGVAIKNEEHLRDVIEKLLEEFKNNKEIKCNSSNIDKYSRRIQVEKLSIIIKEICTVA